MKIGYRTLKTAIGAATSIFIAEQLGLEFYTSAGILTILSIQITKKRSLRTSFDRIASCLLGLVYSFVFFEIIGYYPFTIMLILLTFLPLLVSLKIVDGFVSSSVVILHIFMLKEFDILIILNEIGVIGVGIGVGLLMNLYMPNIEKDLSHFQKSIEENFSTILKEFTIFLRNGESTWDGKEMIETAELLNRAKSLAIQDVENHLFRAENQYYFYFEMREKQFELLERMLPIVSSLYHFVPQGVQMADFLEDLGNHVHSGNTAFIYLAKLQEMRREIDNTPLPVIKEEFEVRASLFYLLNEIEQYLIIKDLFGKEHYDKKQNQQSHLL